MVEDSIAKVFDTSAVTVAGIDAGNSTDTAVGAFISGSGVTYPMGETGAGVAGSYGVTSNTIVVIDRNGVVQFVEAYSPALVSDAAAAVRALVNSGVLVPMTRARPRLSDATTPRRIFTLSGRAISGARQSTLWGVANGRGVGVVRSGVGVAERTDSR